MINEIHDITTLSENGVPMLLLANGKTMKLSEFEKLLRSEKRRLYKDFKEWLNETTKKWLKNPKIYEDRVANYSMSPKEFEKYWQNKDSMKEPIDNGDKCSPTIKNSTGNRTPNFQNITKRVDKVIYWFGAVSYARDYNYLPTSMIINKKGQKQFLNILGFHRIALAGNVGRAGHVALKGT